MYLGEITRNILVSLVDAGPKPLLFNGRSSDILNTHYGLDTAVMSEVEEVWESGRVFAAPAESAEHEHSVNGSIPIKEATTPEIQDWQDAKSVDVDQLSADDIARLERIREIVIQRLSLASEDVSLRDAAIVRWAASLVANRAAKLSGCAVAAVLVQTGRAKLGGGFATEEEKIGVGVDGR